MLLGVIPMFWVFEDFLRKIAKEQKRKSRQTRAPMPQRREPTLRRSLTP